LMQDEKVGSIRPTKSSVGKAFRIDDAQGRYIVYLKNTFPQELDLSGLRIVIDCAHGAAYKVAPTILEELGATVYTLGNRPDGRNINRECGALFPKSLQKGVKEYHAHVGIALDGDADRLLAVDELGDVIDGDVLLAILANDQLRQKNLNKNILVTTVMSNLALDIKFRELGASVIRTAVGDRYVVEEMRKHGYNFGGENSGHIVYSDHATTGDGMLAALKLLAILKREQTSLKEMQKTLILLPQVLLNVAVLEKRPLHELPRVQKAIHQVEKKLGRSGRVMVRYSGTESKVRILVEGPKTTDAQRLAEQIATTFKDS